MRRALPLAFLLVASVAPAGAQDRPPARDTTPRGDKTFFTRRDLLYSGIALGTSAAVSHFDVRVARWSQGESVQGSQSRQDLVEQLTQVNETPLTIAAAATYLVGRATRSATVTDVGLHVTEALVLDIVASELIRGPVGRVRPRASPGEQYEFELNGGFTKFEHRSFPSLHASAAFATASALVEELQVRRPGAVKFAAPMLYTAALVPGFTRIHLDEHWISDVVAGAFVGALLGSRVVSYAHSHGQNWLDRKLLGVSVVPANGGLALSVQLAP